MITLHVLNDLAYVWNSDDWAKLQTHRIVGNLVGCLAVLPRQEFVSGLPMELLPEESALLFEKEICCFKELSSLQTLPSKKVLDEFKQYEKQNRVEQIEVLKETRKVEIATTIDRIVKGKQAKLKGEVLSRKRKRAMKNSTECIDTGQPQEEPYIDKEEVLREEMLKIQPAKDQYLGVQTFTGDPWTGTDEEKPVTLTYPKTRKQVLHYKTYRDLWERGFYVTRGEKFGANYLAYPGHPNRYHSHFVVVCVEYDEIFKPSTLVAYGRLGQAVRKTVALSYIDDQQCLQYQSIQWRGE